MTAARSGELTSDPGPFPCNRHLPDTAVAVLNSIKRGARPKFDHTAPPSLRKLCPTCWGPRKARMTFAELLPAYFEAKILEREWTARHRRPTELNLRTT